MDNRFAANYNRIFRNKQYKLEALGLQKFLKGKSVLDVGCGTGLHAQELMKLGFEVDGLEPHPVLFEQARKIIPNVSNTIIEESDIQKTYDNIICMFQVFNYVQNANIAAKKMHSLLKKNGRLVIDMLTEESKLKEKAWVWDWLYTRKMTVDRSLKFIYVNFDFPFLFLKESFKHVAPPQGKLIGLLQENGFFVERIIFNSMDNLIICTKI